MPLILYECQECDGTFSGIWWFQTAHKSRTPWCLVWQYTNAFLVMESSHANQIWKTTSILFIWLKKLSITQALPMHKMGQKLWTNMAFTKSCKDASKGNQSDKCYSCDKTFLQKSTLDIHINDIHGKILQMWVVCKRFCQTKWLTKAQHSSD